MDVTLGVIAHDPPLEDYGRVYNATLNMAFVIQDSMRHPCWDSCGFEDQECTANCQSGAWFDHLVIANLDDPIPYGMVVPTYELYDPSHEDHIGQWGFTWTCTPHPSPPPPDSCRPHVHDEVFTQTGEAGPIYTNLPWCGRWRIYYFVNDRDWDVLCLDSNHTWPAWGGTPCRVMMNLGDDGRPGCTWIPNLVDYIESLPEGQWDFKDVDLDSCYEHPPGDAHLKFLGYVDPRGGNGEHWLPTPKDSIGLAFSISSESGRRYRLSYAIWDVSMWQGECLNSPRFAATPKPTDWEGPIRAENLDTLGQWDFMVCRPERYTMFAQDVKRTYMGWHAVPPGQRPDSSRGWPEECDVFRQSLVVTTVSEVEQDTLWLKARDYAAHCLVTPQVVDGGGKDNLFLRDFLSPYNGERLFSVTVPYDYDGPGSEDVPFFQTFGVNYGDGMADWWEFNAFHLPRPQDVRTVLPFVVMPPGGPPAFLADRDSLPKGRDIRGDYLCNFEEYRGAIVSPGVHQRFDPLTKTVFIHLRTNLDSVVREAMPGYIYGVNTGGFQAEIFFTDSMKWGPDPTWDSDLLIEGRRREGTGRFEGRSIDYNRLGAARWHLGYGLPNNVPTTDSVANAITWWRWNGSLDSLRAPHPPGVYGTTFGARVWPVGGDSANGGMIPRWVIRSCVALSQFEYCHARPPYSTDTTLWNDHFPRVLKNGISHEVGHGIGMIHGIAADPNRAQIMNQQARILNGPWLISDSTYADSSKSQFSTQGTLP